MRTLTVRGAALDRPGEASLVVAIRDGRIESVRPSRAEQNVDIDARQLVVVSGFIDLQCNGGWGIDLTSEPERLWELASMLPRHGVTAFLPTLVSCPPAVVERAAATLSSRPPGFVGAEPLGLHLEGPMLSSRYRGAHDSAMLRPALPAGMDCDHVAMVTLAPELDGAIEVIRILHTKGVVVAAGHTDATAAQFIEAVEAGLTGITHLFNCMRPIHHREVGPAGVAMTDERVVAGLIADGVHVSRRAVAIAFATMRSRLALVTDSVAAAGSNDGVVRMGGRVIRRTGDEVRDERGVLAGSTLTMDRAVRNLMAFTGCTFLEAVRAATEVPAGLLGIDRGQLVAGAPADLVLLTPDGEVVTTIAGGSVVHGEAAWRS
jgi:N-acetylglucosamine-6-phosphate deacetylase